MAKTTSKAAAKASSRSIPAHYQRLEGSERHPPAAAKHLGLADPDEVLQVSIVLRRRPDGPAVPDFDHFANTHPSRRPRLSQEEFAARHGAAPADLAAVGGFARAQGLSVVESHAARRTVVVSGTTAQMSRAFAVKLGRYRHQSGGKSGTETWRGLDGHIHLPKELAGMVIGVFGLDNRGICKRAINEDPPVTAQLQVQTAAQCYNFPTNQATGQNIAILTPSGYYPPDLQQYFGGTPPVVDVFTGTIAANGQQADGETTQDICIAASAAPGATIAVYFLYGDESGWVGAVQRIVHPDPGDPICLVAEASYYICEGDDLPTLQHAGISVNFVDAFHLVLQDAALQGVTYVTVSGDYGTDTTAYHGATSDGQAHVTYPASDPYALACGGTTLGANSGTVGPQNFVEYVWNDQWGATGGGVSNYFPVPGYQANVAIPNSYNGGKPGRGVPDVAANASGLSGYPIIVNNMAAVGEGTSAAGPLYAGLIAVINAALSSGGMHYSVGFLNPMLYALGESVCRDVDAIDPGGSAYGGRQNNQYLVGNSQVPGYPAGKGWDCCTGWGSLNGMALLTALQQGTQQDCYIILDWGTFTQSGIVEMQGPLHQPAQFPNAFYIVVEGLSAAQLGIGSANPLKPQFAYSPQAPTGMTIQAGPAQADANVPLRFTYPCQITFIDTSDFPAPPQEVSQLGITASITANLSASTSIELSTQSTPFMVAGPLSWLSNDIRVFQMEPGGLPAWLQQLNALLPSPVVLQDTGSPSQAPYDADARIDATYFMQQLIDGFNAVADTAPPNHPFDAIPADETASALDTLEADTATNQPVFNFAVARVRYQDPAADAESVRVFFRSFPALAISTAYDQTTTYRRWSDGVESGHTIPLLGSQYDAQMGQQLETVPFFAVPRVNTAQVSMDTQTDLPNVRTIAHDSGGGVTYAYYGCWLDLNQTSEPWDNLFPQTPTSDGPFSGPLGPVQQFIGNLHQCLTVEIAYDPAPIATGSVPGSCQQLGQRNLTLAPAANPGDAASRSIPNTFEMRPTPADLPEGAAPDQLMIDWGDVPAGTMARLYLPGIDVADLLLQTATRYGRHQLTLLDAHTLKFTAGGITYLPIPGNHVGNIAALLSVDLPRGIRKSQLFKATVAQAGSAVAARNEGALDQSRQLMQRRILGAFQIAIPVSVKDDMLAPEQRSLSLVRWMGESIPASSRWYLVFRRYLSQIAARVQALGGDPAKILPSPIGDWQHPSKPGKVHCEWSGRISGLLFDRFGDFEGFLLDAAGGERRFHSREKKIGELADRAWRERIRVGVRTGRHHPQQLEEIVLLG